MASFAEEIVDFLVTEGHGAKGTTLFYDEWTAAPTSSATTAVVIERGGGEGYRHSPAVVANFDIWVRGATYVSAYQKATDIFNEMHSDTQIQLASHRIMRCIMTTPGSVGYDSATPPRKLLKFSASTIIVPNSAPGGGGEGKGGGKIHPEGP